MPQNNTYKPSLCDQFNAASHRTALVFDLDNTIVDIAPLYGQMELIFTDFLARRLNISQAAACREVLDMLKTTYYVQDEALRRHNIPVAETLGVTYDPQSLNFNALQINPQIGAVLNAITADKFIFTNATQDYAQALLRHLGIKDCFNGIAGTDDFQFMLKPEHACFDAFEARYGLAHKDVHFFEDTPENLDAAYFFKGWTGHMVLGHRQTPPIWSGGAQPHYVRSQIDTLLDLRK
jgi:putative hydrolase of the HAD superfamily